LGVFLAQDVTRPDQQKRLIRPTLSTFGSIIPRPSEHQRQQQQQKQLPVAANGQHVRQQQQNFVQSNGAQQAEIRTKLERQGSHLTQHASFKTALSTGGQSPDLGRVFNQPSIAASVPQLGLQPCRQGLSSATSSITAASAPQSPRISARQGLRCVAGGSTAPSVQSPRITTRQGLRNATGSTTAVSAPQSPRMATRPMRLGDFGAMLPRPQHQLQLRQRTLPQQEQAALGHVASDLPLPDTHSSVVHEPDGFELFYGVAGAGGEEEEAENPSRLKRDGFDRFYGIRKRDKLSASQPTLDTSEVAEQRRLCQSPRAAAFKVLAPKSVESSMQKQLAEAPTYSLATPAVPMPPTTDSVPRGVQFFPVHTPGRNPKV